LCGVDCEICEEILSKLNEPSWFCKISRQVRWDRRVVRRHLTNLIDHGEIQVRNFGTVKLYKKKVRTKPRC